jgi:integrase
MAYAEKVYKVRGGQKTKQFTWRARYKRPDGTWGSEPGFPTKRTAEEYGEQQEAAIRAGRWADPTLARTPFGRWVREWMAAKSPRGQTVTTRWARLDAHILPRWEHVPLQQITWFDAEQWANSLSCDDSTATQCLTIMSQILTGAVDKGLILVNPLFGRRRSRTAEAKAARDERDETTLWAPPEVVLQLARRAGPLDGMHILTTAFTGVRWGESLALRPSSLKTRVERDFTCPILDVVEEVAEYQKRGPAGERLGIVLDLEPVKTRESKRRIDLPPFLAELLEKYAADCRRQFLFATRGGGHWRRANFGRQVMRPCADGREALPATKGHAPRGAWEPIMPGLTMRALRHTHDTYQDQIGVKPALMYEQAGHKRPGIKAVYQHPTPEMRRVRLEGLQEIYEGSVRALGWEMIWPSG